MASCLSPNRCWNATVTPDNNSPTDGQAGSVSSMQDDDNGSRSRQGLCGCGCGTYLPKKPARRFVEPPVERERLVEVSVTDSDLINRTYSAHVMDSSEVQEDEGDLATPDDSCSTITMSDVRTLEDVDFIDFFFQQTDQRQTSAGMSRGTRPLLNVSLESFSDDSFVVAQSDSNINESPTVPSNSPLANANPAGSSGGRSRFKVPTLQTIERYEVACNSASRDTGGPTSTTRSGNSRAMNADSAMPHSSKVSSLRGYQGNGKLTRNKLGSIHDPMSNHFIDDPDQLHSGARRGLQRILEEGSVDAIPEHLLQHGCTSPGREVENSRLYPPEPHCPCCARNANVQPTSGYNQTYEEYSDVEIDVDTLSPILNDNFEPSRSVVCTKSCSKPRHYIQMSKRAIDGASRRTASDAVSKYNPGVSSNGVTNRQDLGTDRVVSQQALTSSRNTVTNKQSLTSSDRVNTRHDAIGGHVMNTRGYGMDSGQELNTYENGVVSRPDMNAKSTDVVSRKELTTCDTGMVSRGGAIINENSAASREGLTDVQLRMIQDVESWDLSEDLAKENKLPTGVGFHKNSCKCEIFFSDIGKYIERPECLGQERSPPMSAGRSDYARDWQEFSGKRFPTDAVPDIPIQSTAVKAESRVSDRVGNKLGIKFDNYNKAIMDETTESDESIDINRTKNLPDSMMVHQKNVCCAKNNQSINQSIGVNNGEEETRSDENEVWTFTEGNTTMTMKQSREKVKCWLHGVNESCCLQQDAELEQAGVPPNVSRENHSRSSDERTILQTIDENTELCNSSGYSVRAQDTAGVKYYCKVPICDMPDRTGSHSKKTDSAYMIPTTGLKSNFKLSTAEKFGGRQVCERHGSFGNPCTGQSYAHLHTLGTADPNGMSDDGNDESFHWYTRLTNARLTGNSPLPKLSCGSINKRGPLKSFVPQQACYRTSPRQRGKTQQNESFNDTYISAEQGVMYQCETPNCESIQSSFTQESTARKFRNKQSLKAREVQAAMTPCYHQDRASCDASAPSTSQRGNSGSDVRSNGRKRLGRMDDNEIRLSETVNRAKRRSIESAETVSSGLNELRSDQIVNECRDETVNRNSLTLDRKRKHRVIDRIQSYRSSHLRVTPSSTAGSGVKSRQYRDQNIKGDHTGMWEGESVARRSLDCEQFSGDGSSYRPACVPLCSPIGQSVEKRRSRPPATSRDQRTSYELKNCDLSSTESFSAARRSTKPQQCTAENRTPHGCCQRTGCGRKPSSVSTDVRKSSCDEAEPSWRGVCQSEISEESDHFSHEDSSQVNMTQMTQTSDMSAFMVRPLAPHRPITAKHRRSGQRRLKLAQSLRVVSKYLKQRRGHAVHRTISTLAVL